MTADELKAFEIPSFLKRNKGDAQVTQETQTKRKRTKTELPTEIVVDGTTVTLAGMDLPYLARAQTNLKELLADVPRLELELRAINQEIRRRAR